MNSNHTNQEVQSWQDDIARLSERGDDETFYTREQYTEFLTELGYDAPTLEAMDTHVTGLVTQANGHFKVAALRSGLSCLDDALKLAPWRTELHRTYAENIVTLYLEDGEADDGDEALACLNDCLRRAPKSRWVYPLLKQVQDKRTQSKRMAKGWAIGIGAFVLISAGIVTLRPLTHDVSSGVVHDDKPVRVMQPASQGKNALPLDASGTFDLDVDLALGRYGKLIEIDSSESSRTAMEYSEVQSAKLKLRLRNEGRQVIRSLNGRVDWVSDDGRVLSSQPIALIKKSAGLYPGESAVSYQSQFSLDRAVRRARLTITESVDGPETKQRPAGKPVCVLKSAKLKENVVVDVTVYGEDGSGPMAKRLYGITNRAAPITSLVVTEKAYDADGALIPEASRQDILNQKQVASTLLPIFETGETRYVEILRIIKPEIRDRIKRRCLFLTTKN
ncbi:MAG: hypothetical protein ACON3Z_01795 [Bradymonadia bacterium]